MRNVKGITDTYAYAYAHLLCRRQRYGYGHDGRTRGYEKEVKCIPMSHGLGLAHGCLSLSCIVLAGSKKPQVAVAERNLLEHTDYRSLYAPVWTASISAAHRFLSLSVCFKSWDLGVVLSHRPLVCRSFPHRFWVVCTCPSEYLFPSWSFPLNPSLSLDPSCP